MQISEKGLAFLAGHEGYVSRAYIDPAGVVTIGYGFTMRGRVFAAWWRTRHGRKLRLGDTINRRDADHIMTRMLDDEYEIPVERTFDTLPQHQFDACVSVVYNLGARALTWKWAKALKRGDVKEAAGLLRRTGTTAGGHRLNGLVRRRKEEADLLEHGVYTGVLEGRQRLARPVPPKEPDPVVREAQEALTRFGFDPGVIDGWMGQRTKAAVLAYQRQHPDLVNDGIIGPATLAQLRKDALVVKDSRIGGALVTAVTGGGLFGVPWTWILGSAFGLGLILIVYLIWRYGDVLTRRLQGSAVKREAAP
ncbi:glycoside hydrolase family protein [Roseibium sp.]|uniref:glycoside hydrolase family protein n=1 Tax=Roseibium sp. TaxID=1936156 RepID=UPI003B514CB7